MSDDIDKPPDDGLTVLEREEWQKWRRSNDPSPLAASTALKMYELFLLGHSCEEIVRSNENRFPLGLVVDARMRYKWDRRRDEYLNKLFNDAGDIVRQRQIEGAVFLGDVLAAAHKQYGGQLRKFMQTGDVKDLPDQFKADSITKYKMIVDALTKITGQDKKDAPTITPAVQVIGNNVTLAEQPKGAMDSQDALTLLRLLDDKDKK